MTASSWSNLPAFPYGETVRVLRAGRMADPFSGLPTADPDWSTQTVHPVATPRPVYPTTVAERPGQTTTYILNETLTALLPYGTDIETDDRLEVLTGVYTGVYDISSVMHHKNAFVGWEAVCEVVLDWKGVQNGPAVSP